jgi:hypothetical protein
MRALKVVYALAVAAALIALVITGIHAFYPAPPYGWGSGYSAALYGRNVFLIALLLGLVFAVVGAFIQRRTNVFGAGLIVGGMGTMMFSITAYGLGTIPQFIGIVVILAVLIFLGYRFKFLSFLKGS